MNSSCSTDCTIATRCVRSCPITAQHSNTQMARLIEVGLYAALTLAAEHEVGCKIWRADC